MNGDLLKLQVQGRWKMVKRIDKFQNSIIPIILKLLLERECLNCDHDPKFCDKNVKESCRQNIREWLENDR